VQLDFRRFAGFALILCLSGAVLARTPLPPDGEDGLAFMNDEHPMMRKAFARAKAELDEFLALARSPGRNHTSFALKVGLDAGNSGTEYVWIVDFSSDAAGKFTGTINNDVEMTTRFKLGDRYSFRKEDIVDWIYVDRSTHRMYGNYTLCALLSAESAEEAARVKAEYQLDCEL
jgi:uncharacterized protein YegJ (DUF2314 family)